MADSKMSQAQKNAASRSGKKGGSSPEKKPSKKSGRDAAEQLTIQEPQSAIPGRLIAGVVYFALFILFLVIALNQKGWVLDLLKDLVLGLFGKVTFYILVPTFLFLMILQITSRGRPVLMRTICALAFAFLCGCIAHMVVCRGELGTGFALLKSLRQGGIDGTTGGLLCGLVAEGLRLSVDTVATMVLLIVSAVLCLLAAFRITIPGLIRAFQARPRYEEELDEEEDEERPDPSAVLVNTAVEKYHEQKRRKRERIENPPPEPEEDVPKRRSWSAPSDAPEEKIALNPTTDKARSQDIMRQIAGDIDTAVPDEEEKVVPAKAMEEPDLIPIEPEEPVHVVPETREVRSGVAAEPGTVPQNPVQPEPAPVPAPASAAAPVPANPVNQKVSAKEAATAAQAVAQEIAMNSAEEKPVYNFPPINLLRKPKGASADGSMEMKENTRRLNDTLASFKIDAHISNVTRGPSVTRYEVELEKGVRLNKLTSCADDIALSLGASGVRIAPVPGKISVVGIEVPNQTVTTVTLREVIDSGEFTRAKSKSSFAVGKDIGGSAIVGNIAKLPHMLIAGTTGSGKSVCMNSIIISLLYKASPEDVKLIMVDPKMVELGIYNGIPHLLIPVVTDPKKAAGSLQWAVSEMMRRYKAMSDAGVRDLESYNSMIDGQELEGEHLPQVVVIIDELADLMLVAAKEVEESICRIAQMGRAAGIHLIIATQRPSADVITGLMKANIPSRIAFAVASAMESRIILDTQGAEKLVGKGDMLYAPIGCGKPVRVQGCFVSDAEVEAVAGFVKENYTTSYDQQVIEEIERSAANAGTKGSGNSAEPDAMEEENDLDEMLPQAADVVLETGMASVSMLQRRLKLGYARAARIMDSMEELGIVGPYAGSKPRNILLTKEQWEAMKPELMRTGSASIPGAEQVTMEELVMEPAQAE